MSKRKLTDQQRQQISDNQAAQSTNANLGLVVAHYGDSVDVEAEQHIWRCNLRQNLAPIVVGDQVAWQCEHSEKKLGVVVALQPRRSQMLRRNQKGEEKIIAANVDQIFIVVAPEPKRSEQVIDRYLIITQLQAIPAGIIFNKIDQLSDEQIVDKHHELIRYKQLNYPVSYISAQAHQGLEELQAALNNKVTAFVGLSGVGKSSIIQALLPDENIMTQHLSQRGQQGQHTTTTARLYHLPGGGDIIDSPGVREFALEGLTPAEVLQGFPEIYRAAGDCKFRDCRHQQEPGCAVQAALSKGIIHPLRFKAYQAILNNPNRS